MENKKIKLGQKIVGDGEPLYFIADIAANHDGDLQRAFKLIELAKESGADAAKFQNFQAKKIVSNVGFSSLGGQLSHQAKWEKSVFDVYQDYSISFDWTAQLKEKCDQVEIDYFTSPYDFESVDHVDPFVDFYKIGSGDITWLEIIKHIATKKKPILIATGASNLEDVDRAMQVLSKSAVDVVLMQCNTNYTVSSDNFKYINLNVLKTYRQRFPEVVLGLSDHTPGHTTVLGSIALGARVFEKHFTDDNSRKGPDHQFAMNPQSWHEMVVRSKELDHALGDGVKRIEENERETAVVQRRGIYFTKDLPKGHILTADDLISLRPLPMNGVPPYEIGSLISKKLNRAVNGQENVQKGDCIPC